MVIKLATKFVRKQAWLIEPQRCETTLAISEGSWVVIHFVAAFRRSGVVIPQHSR